MTLLNYEPPSNVWKLRKDLLSNQPYPVSFMIATVCLLKPHRGPVLSPFINNMTGALLINPFNLQNKITKSFKKQWNNKHLKGVISKQIL